MFKLALIVMLCTVPDAACEIRDVQTGLALTPANCEAAIKREMKNYTHGEKVKIFCGRDWWV